MLKGNVLDKYGNYLAKTRVVNINSGEKTITDTLGYFNIKASVSDSLNINLYGYKTLKFKIQNEDFLSLILVEDTLLIQNLETIEIGYGSLEKTESAEAISKIKSEEFSQIGSVSPIHTLQGRVAGLQIIAENGEPGADMRVRIRGVGTVNNSAPLYIVNGYPVNDISYLHPKDIESVEVLKDASNTAIYGVRGANGVILIKTKLTNSVKTQFTFDTYQGVSRFWKYIPVNNTSDYIRLKKQAYENDHETMSAEMTNQLNLQNQNNTDWQKEISQLGVIQSYYIGAMGGSEKQRYAITGGYFNQRGTIKNTGVKKYFFSLNNTYQFAKWLKGGININFQRTEKNFNNSNEYVGGLNNAIITDPLTNVKDPQTGNWGYANLSSTTNPARVIDLQKNSWNKQNFFNSIFYLETKFNKYFSFKSQFGYTYTITKNNIYVPVYNVGPWEQNSVSVLYDTRGFSNQWVSSNYLNFEKSTSTQTFKILLGSEAQASNYNIVSVSVTDVPEAALQQYISSSTGSASANTIASDQAANSLLSFFARANYAFKSKYFLNCTVRRDGSSQFTPKNRWGNFPSFSLGWNLAEENFLKLNKKINTLKLRSGWGVVGNLNSIKNYYAAYTLINGGNNYSFGGVQVPGYTVVNMGNSDLKWEQTQSMNLGVDIEMWNNKFWVTTDCFLRKTKGMIIQVPSPDYIGANAPETNAGAIKNMGVEIATGYKNKIRNKLTYQIAANFTSIKNTVTSVQNAPIHGGAIWNIGYTTLTTEGLPVGTFWGLQTNGIFHSQQEVNNYSKNGVKIQPNAQAGDVKFVDKNDDGKIDEKDYTNLGSPLPKFTYGLSLNTSYQNFDLRIYLMGVYGNKIVNGLNGFTQSSNGRYNSTVNRNNAWTPENPNSNEPRMTLYDANQNMRFSDRYVESGSYLRLQNITLGYTITQKSASKIKMQSIRFYMGIDNLLTFTKYKGLDPEIGQTLSNVNNPLNYGVDLGNYPQARTYRLGMSLGI
ncbi:MAG: SusC/RagA family TonB-linked outer membrane protein [Cytophagales bacterium]